MRTSDIKSKAILKAAVLAAAIFLLGAGASFGQQQVNLTAAPTTTTLPDGTTVPMWGYFCGTAVTGATATCAALNPGSVSVTPGVPSTWSPVVITVPVAASGATSLTINLTNSLSFIPTTGSAVANTVPTSIMIVGQVGGGLGDVTQRTTTPSPSHADAQGCVTWFIANTSPGQPCTTTSPIASPPVQANRVQSFSTEVAAGATTSLTWPALRPGTYLLESGTHPSIQVPMGLIGVLVVTAAPSGATAGTAYPGAAATSTTAAVPAVQYNAELPLEFSEIDPVQNKEVDLAVRTAGFNETAVWTRMNAFGPVTALTLSSGGTGYTTAPSVTISGGGAGSGATATATVGALVSAVSVTGGGTGYSATPTVTINDATGSGATATATVVGGVITAITVTNPGSFYTAPTVAITDSTGTGATATASIVGSYGVIYALNLTNGGDGYTSAPLVSFSGTGGATATASITLGGCGGGAHTCYPPAVNYTPFYYLINGRAFDKTNAMASLYAATAGVTSTAPVMPVTTGITGTVLVRMVNAGLRMHVPSTVGSLTQGFNGAGAAAPVSGFTLIAEDGNPVPGVQAAGAASAPAAPRVQTDVFMAAGKTFDVMINAPAACTPVAPATTCTPAPAIPVYDRELSLSGNSSERDAGMLAYIGVNGAGLPAVSTSAGGAFASSTANPDTYNSVPACLSTATSCIPFVVSDVSKGVIANDINVYGVQLLAAPTHGTLTCTSLGTGLCANGTFTYTPTAGSTFSGDSFTYCANNGFVPATTTTAASCSSAALTATVTLGKSTLTGNPTAANVTYTATMSTFIKIPSPGPLSASSDPNGLPLTVVTSPAPTISGGTLVMDAQGGFTASIPAHTGTATVSFPYTVQNSQGSQSSSSTPGMVTINFPSPSNLQVTVLDAQAYSNCQGDSTCISGLATSAPITDYRWIIEEDRTFWNDPNCQSSASITTSGCPTPVTSGGTVPVFAANFHASTMPFVAQGCTGPLSCEGGQTMLDNNPSSATFGQHIAAVCDLGNGACRPDTTGNGFTQVSPASVHLDPSKRYYISVLPGDAGNPFPSYQGQPNCLATPYTSGTTLNTQCGHTMAGAPIPPACNILVAGCSSASSATFAPVTVLALPTPLPPGKLSVMVFEDDFPLNGEQDAGGGIDVLSPNEPGLGGFNIVLWDTYGGLGDVTGQDTYDMFNEPLSNSLAGTIDPVTGLDACPLTANPLSATGNATPGTGTSTPSGSITGNGGGPAQATGMTGMIVTCPKYESDGKTLSPLAGQALIANLMPDKFSVQAYPGADRIARGEEWLQTNTLDGQHPHDSFIRIGEPGYFQEYGPAGYHVSIGFANPKIINDRHDAVCAGAFGPVGACTGIVKGQVDVQRMSRTPDQRLYPSGSRDALAWTQCWVSLGDPDAEDFMFTKCDAQGNFQFTGVPGGNWRLTIGDQWNDQIIDGLSTPANVVPGQTLNMGNIGVQQWQANIYTRTYVDDNKDGIWEPNEIGIPLIYTKVRYRDGHNANSLTTDFNGIASFNETFPLFNWYVVQADSGRYKTTGIHTVYDAGGPADGSTYCGPGNGARPCGTSTAYNNLVNTFEATPLPADLSVPGAVYCAAADCTAEAALFQAGTAKASSSTASTGRIDPPWVGSEGTSALLGESIYIDFGKAPYAACSNTTPLATVTPGCVTGKTWGENGGIHGFVDYSSTRPFDSAEQMIEQPWEPYVPGVRINLYQEGFATDGVTPTLTLVDTTVTSSWDDWAQGFYPNSTAGGTGQKPYMSCPGQTTNTSTAPAVPDLYFFTLNGQPNYLDMYNAQHNGGTQHTLPYNSQFKCYDAMHIWTQLQPAPYDGEYQFPSSLGVDPTTGKQLTTQITAATSPIGKAASMPGTYCTICVANPTHATPPVDDSYDPYRAGTPMLPPGKYVVEVVMPPGYEVYKEEDKNLLIGDDYIAPVTQQFGGLGADIFILPDQAAVASLYDPNNVGYNPNNFQDATTGLSLQGGMLSGVPGFPGYQDPVWPCVGEMRVVPDYLSLFPQAKEVAPFAGALRPLCDRKEITLANQMSVSAKFYIYTSTHIASKFTGVITDDFTSEFDPFAPQFGEKFGPPSQPVSTRDYLGNEISRVYSDRWGIYDGLTFSSWEVNPPNITGYSPSMMVQCMNDAGPILDTRAQIPNPSNPTMMMANPTYGQMINDPLYNPAYSDFCYEEPYMPGLTTYLDTPVVPTQAFVGAGYNNTDCNYPDATPAIAEVDSSDGIGPWVSAAGTGHTLTITALGNQMVNNYGYGGPSATALPFDAPTVNRHYGFGTQCTAVSASCTAVSGVTIGGVPAAVTNWIDTSITVTVPTGVPPCAIQQQAQYGGSPAQCGQLVVTAGNGKQSIDAVTVTIGGKAPFHHVAANESIQSWIDQAAPGDLIIVDPTCTSGTGTAPTVVPCTTGIAATNKAPASHTEMLIMWKPVRLQGAGAASTIINANTHPAGKLLDPWRRHIDCLFGLTLQGVPYTGNVTLDVNGNPVPGSGGTAPYDPTGGFTCPDTGWNYFTAQPNVPQIDRLPLEATVGWTASLNGNLAELLQEPSLMGAYEGAGITVLAKGLDFHGQAPWNDGTEAGAFPTVTTLLTGIVSNPGAAPGAAGGLQVGDANPLCVDGSGGANRFPSNFICNPSSIDGLSVTNSSQGGGGIFVHGWAHYMQIANNRIYNNAGSLSGGISVGQGEFALPYIQGGATNAAPGSCSDGTGFVTNQHLPMCLQLQANVHNNMITNNSSIGDELFSATLSGGGGATVCTGNDYYKFNYNWVCGNLSAGEGGGIVHLGEIQNGHIEHNSFVFNQSSNPTIPTNGGGIMVQGTPDTDPVCPGVPDTDCPPGLSDGTGHGLLINANLVQGNSADSGSGGGIRLQQVNGTEVGTFHLQPQYWNDVTITNNIISNNMAGWDGAGISLQDALHVSIVNNTISHNDTLASSGVLTNSIGAPQASAPPGNCTMPGPTGADTASCPQSAGVTSTLNSSLMAQAMSGLSITCPWQPAQANASCGAISDPLLYNNIIWQNRAFYVGVGNLGSGTLNQQKLVSLFDAFTSTAAPAQTATGACSAGVTYWDLGVRGDRTLTGHESGFRLFPVYSVLTSTAGGYGTFAFHNTTADPAAVAEYCNGSRVPPECTVADGCGGLNGFGVPPGISDAVTPNPVFSLVPAATVDEGNNWINVSWGPLSLSNPSVTGGANANYGGGPALGNYVLQSSSPAIDYIQCGSGVPAPACSIAPETNGLPQIVVPSTDFFGNPRPNPDGDRRIDVGAVEFQGGRTAAAPPTLTSMSPNVLIRGNAVVVTFTGTNLSGATGLVFSNSSGMSVSGLTPLSPTQVGATILVQSFVLPSARTVAVTTPGGTSNALPFTIVNPQPPTLTASAPTSGAQGTQVPVTLTGSNFTTNGTSVAVSGAGVSVNSVTVLNSTTLTANFRITPGAARTSRNITVTTAGGGSATLTGAFTVVALTAPTLTAISPASATHPTSGSINVPVTLTGTNFTFPGGTNTITISGAGVTLTGPVTDVNPTTITATFAVSSTAAAGARNVTVTTSAGTTTAVTFTVN